ncbi:MAG: lipoyl(octanoyl) transferase LipB [Verrucomicrobiae bacterium]|nr:lipoyl(octanoyl) transferase LipB [Verrucomicrobiae bacterium]
MPQPSPETAPSRPAFAKAPELTFRWLGRIGYDEALTLQEALVQQRKAGEIGDTVLMLEHEPVYTIGRTRDRSSLRNPDTLPHPVVEINRGGQATWHGPGQLVGYLILDLHGYGCDLHTYLRALEEAQIMWLQSEGVTEAGRREGLTGVWIGNRKISSIGVGVRNWISMHGFALNVSRDLSGFDAIVPCGISDVKMTSVERENGRDWDVEQVALGLQDHLSRELSKLMT